MSAPSSEPGALTRRPYKGSCHCGNTSYILYMTLPPAKLEPNPSPRTSTLRIYKCNCSTCRKLGFFHIRPQNSPNDFMLLSPLDPLSGGLGEYRCFDKRHNWTFCKTCGARCFAFSGGEGEVVDREVDGEMRKVWMIKREGWNVDVSKKSYLSVNAHTLEAGQEGLDFREWVEKGWIAYLDARDRASATQMGVPHDGDMY